MTMEIKTPYKVFFTVTNKKSKIHGMGTYAEESIPAKKK